MTLKECKTAVIRAPKQIYHSNTQCFSFFNENFPSPGLIRPFLGDQ